MIPDTTAEKPGDWDEELDGKIDIIMLEKNQCLIKLNYRCLGAAND